MKQLSSKPKFKVGDKLISKNLETAEMSLTGVLKAIFETEVEEENE